MKLYAPYLFSWIAVILSVSQAVGQFQRVDIYQNFRHLDLEDGLPDLEVRIMCEDTFGFVWVGTGRGIVKFDGQRFIPLDSDSEIPVPRLFVHCMVRQGRTIWTGTNLGLFEIDTHTDEITPHPINTGDKTDYLGLIDLALDDTDESLWLGFGRTNDQVPGGLVHYNPGTRKATLFADVADAPIDIRCIQQDSRDPDLLWLGGQSFHHFRKSAGEFTEHDWPELRANSLFCHDIVETPGDTLLLGTSEWGVVPFSRNNRKFDKPILIRSNPGADNIANHILPLQNQRYLVSSRTNPPLIMDLNRNVIEAFKTNRDTEPFRTPTTVTSSSIIGASRIAMSSFDGIFLLNPEAQHFVAEEILPSNEIEARGMHLEQPVVDLIRNRIIIPGYYGIVVLDTTCTRLDTIITNVTGTATSAFGYESVIVNDSLYAVLNSAYVLLIDANDLTSRIILQDDELPYKVSLSTMQIQDDGRLWIGTRDNYYAIWDPVSDTHELYRLDENRVLDSAAQSRVYSISSTFGDHIFVGARSGLYRIDTRDMTSMRIQDIHDGWSLPPGDVPAALQAVNDSILVIGTFTGLHALNCRAKSIDRVGEADGGNFYVANLTLDSENRVWGVTQRGLIVYDHENQYFRRFTLADGLKELVLSRYGLRADNKGHVFITYKTSVSRFNASEAVSSEEPLKIRYTGFNVLGDSLSIGTGLNASSTIELGPGQNFINVSFTSIDFGSPRPVYYEYRIPQLDEGWQQLGTESSVTFSHMKPGKYSMFVRASYDKLHWTENDQPLTWRLPAFYYQQWWFFAILALIGLIIAWRVYNWRITLLRQQEEIRARAAEAEMQALRAQMNPHFIFNSLNSIKSFIANNDRRNAADYLSKFSKLIRLILNNSKQDWVTLTDELKALELYIELEAIRLTGKISYEINVGQDVETDYVEVPPLIFQPYVENAIWHGLRHNPEGGTVRIDICRKGDRIRCSIEDNGVGREKAAEFNRTKSTRHNSLGTSITQERLSGYFAQRGSASIKTVDLYNPDGSAAGTRIIIEIPVN